MKIKLENYLERLRCISPSVAPGWVGGGLKGWQRTWTPLAVAGVERDERTREDEEKQADGSPDREPSGDLSAPISKKKNYLFL